MRAFKSIFNIYSSVNSPGYRTYMSKRVRENLCLWCAKPKRTENLLYVKHTNVDKVTLVGVVERRSFDDNGVGGKVDTPCERCRAA